MDRPNYRYFTYFHGLPSELWIVFSAILVNRMGTMGLPFLLLFLLRERGLTTSTATFIFSLYGITAVLIAPIAGRLCDKVPPIVIMQITLLGSGLAALLVPQFSRPILIAICVIVWAMLSEGFRPANYAYVTSLSGQGQQRQFLSVSRLAVNLGMSIGPALGGLLASWSFRSLFIVDGLTSLMAGAILYTNSRGLRGTALKLQPRAVGKTDRYGRTKFGLLLWALIAMVPVELVFFEQQSALPLFVTGPLHLRPLFYGLAFTVNTALIIILEVPLSTRLAGVSTATTTAIGAVLIGCGFGALTFSTSFFSLAVPIGLWTFGEMLFLPGSAAYVAEIAPDAKRGTFMGLYQMGLSGAFALSPLVGIGSVNIWGFAFFWKACFWAAIISAVSLAFLRLRSAPKHYDTI